MGQDRLALLTRCVVSVLREYQIIYIDYPWTPSTAHQKAYVDCDIIHRDISVGNILILPILRLGAKAKYVYWTGVLTDWELAKDVKIEIARQPERTVSCGFQVVPGFILIQFSAGHLAVHVAPMSQRSYAPSPCP